ncbi:MAG: Do family serine endopeptidase [Syntrophobacter sp.]
MKEESIFREAMKLGLTVFVAVCVFAAMTAAPVRAEVNLVTAIQEVAKKNIPTVVHIEVVEKQQIENPLLPFQDDPFFRYFFGNPNRQSPRNSEREIRGIGSGVLMDEQGHILTNSHVVSGATKIRVILSDGRRYGEESVKVVGTDPKTDLAVIRIVDKTPFPFATFGDSDKVDVGTWVVAIGHPQGLDQTVTQGIISAKHRRGGMSDPTSYQDFLQTDAAINPGNSGGPLINLDGEVIGINAAIVSSSGGFEGIGFAIPSNMALHVARQLTSTGRVERGWLGVTIQDLTPELAQSFGLPNIKGVLIANVFKDGPADLAGIRQGDVVVGYEGREVLNSGDFRNQVATAPIARDVMITLVRDGKTMEVKVNVGSEKKQEQALLESTRDRFGVVVRAMTDKESRRLRMSSGKGVVVSRVVPKGVFGRAGIEAGDIILQIDQQRIQSPEEFAANLSTLPSKQEVLLGVVDHRSGQSGFVRLTTP